MSARLFCLRQIPSKVGVTRCHICSLFTLIMRCCHFDYSAHTWATLQTGVSLTLNLVGFCDCARGLIEPSQTDIYACAALWHYATGIRLSHSRSLFTMIILVFMLSSSILQSISYRNILKVDTLKPIAQGKGDYFGSEPIAT